MSQGTQRKLAAIVSADVVGYSRLMGIDEAGTLKALRAHRSELIDPKVAEHGGRIVKTMGDGLLLEFSSVVNATQCAVEIQKGMARRNVEVPEDRRIIFRIGVNLGDIIIDGEDILGDGVNVAARLQEIAEPGGVSISRRVHEDVLQRLDASFEDVGEQALKNIARPVHVWRWIADHDRTPAPAVQATGYLQLLEKPMVAVLPFANMSGDPEQEHFADGISEDIITALSLWRSFPVIARNSTFAYKGHAVDVRKAAEDLGAQYIVEGSVRKIGNRVRITAQLIDAEVGHHLWAERFDRDLADIFELQDEISERVVSSIEPTMQRAEEQRAFQKRPTDLNAWDYIHRASGFKSSSGHGYGTKDANAKARECLDEALELDPNSAQALAQLAQCEFHDAIQGWSDDTEAALGRSLDYAREAVAKDGGNWMAHAVLGLGLLFGKGQADMAVDEVREAVRLNQSSSLARHCLGCALEFLGKPEEAIPQLQAVFRLDPRYRNAAAAISDLALSNLLIGNHEEAISWAQKAVTSHPAFVRGRQRLIAALGAAGRKDEAKLALDELLQLQPGFSVEYVRSTYPFKEERHLAILVNGLVAAGLPE